jgi:hypothetical protein
MAHTKYILNRYRDLLFTIISAISLMSCNEQVDFNNPLDPNVALVPPSNLSVVSMTDSSAILQWQRDMSVTNGDQLRQLQIIIEYSLDNKNYVYLDSTDARISTLSIHKMFTVNTPYYFRAHFKVVDKSSKYSGVTNRIVSFLGPSNFVASVVCDSVRIITWKDNTDLEDHYYIERRTYDSQTSTLLATLPANTTSFVDTTFSQAKTIDYRNFYDFYRIYAITPSGTKSSVDSLGFVIVNPGPTSLRFTVGSSISLQWTNDWIAWGWSPTKVERKEESNTFQTISILDNYESQYSDSQVQRSINYQYRIQYLYVMTSPVMQYSATPFVYTRIIKIP